MGWTFDPLPLSAIGLAGLLYARRARTLSRRRAAVPPRKWAAFGLALAALLVAVASPLDSIGEKRLFSVHMAQHLLIGDVAPLLAVSGLTGPLLRPVLAVRPVQRLRALAHPLVALPLWAVDLYAWHVPTLYDAALHNAAVHALEHAFFFSGGALLWTALLEPLPGPRWFGPGPKLAALGFVWLAGGILSNVFIWSGHAFYPPYVTGGRLWGLSPVTDQRLGGGLMLLEMSIVVLAVFVWLGLRWLRVRPDIAT